MSNVEFDCEIGFRGHERSYDASVEWYAIKVPDPDCLPCHSYNLILLQREAKKRQRQRQRLT